MAFEWKFKYVSVGVFGIESRLFCGVSSTQLCENGDIFSFFLEISESADFLRYSFISFFTVFFQRTYEMCLFRLNHCVIVDMALRWLKSKSVRRTQIHISHTMRLHIFSLRSDFFSHFFLRLLSLIKFVHPETELLIY